MIIVEGPDAAGKSTLVGKLAREHSLVPVDSPGGPEGTVARAQRALARAVDAEDHVRPFVYDRCYFSELVYSEAMGRECQFTPQQRWANERILKALQIPVIFCLPPLGDTLTKFQESEHRAGEALVDEEIHKQTWKLYHGLLTTWQSYGAIRYDYTLGTGARRKVDELVNSYLRFREGRTWHS